MLLEAREYHIKYYNAMETDLEGDLEEDSIEFWCSIYVVQCILFEYMIICLFPYLNQYENECSRQTDRQKERPIRYM